MSSSGEIIARQTTILALLVMGTYKWISNLVKLSLRILCSTHSKLKETQSQMAKQKEMEALTQTHEMK